MRRSKQWIGGIVVVGSLLALTSCDGMDTFDYSYLAVGDAGFQYAPLGITDVRLDGREPDYLEQAVPHEFVFEDVDPGIYNLEFTFAQVPMETTIQVNSGGGRFNLSYVGTYWERASYGVVMIDPPRPVEGSTFALEGESLRVMTNIGMFPKQTYKRFRLDGRAPDRVRKGPPYELLWDNLKPGRFTMTFEHQGESASVEFELRKEGAMMTVIGPNLYSASREYSISDSDRSRDDSQAGANRS